MPDDQRTIGVIAGNGIYPETFLKAARAHEVRLVVCAFEGETNKEVEALADEVVWLRVGQLKKMIKFFTGHGAKEAVMVGQIAPRNLFDFRPDLRMIGMLAKLKEKNAESLFGAIAGELSKDGVELLSATTFLEEYLPGPGLVCGPALDQKALEDAAYGFKIAKETSRLDIGQTVVVRDGTVLAVEAFEGTNSCIKRGGELGKGKNVKVIKVTKPNQDFRFDVPVVGPETIRTCVDAKISTIVVEAGCTLLLGADEVRGLCEKHSVTLHAMSGEEI